jgi:hypothetical protein
MMPSEKASITADEVAAQTRVSDMIVEEFVRLSSLPQDLRDLIKDVLKTR